MHIFKMLFYKRSVWIYRFIFDSRLCYDLVLLGVYKNDGDFSVYIGIGDIPELNEVKVWYQT